MPRIHQLAVLSLAPHATWEIEQASLQLDAAGVPLREEQRQRIVDVMVDERERMPQLTWTAGVPDEQSIAQLLQWQDEYEKRVRSRVLVVLTSDQLRQYDVYRNLQSKLRRRQMDAWQESPQQQELPRG